MAEALLELKGVHTHIAQYHILHGVDFAVPKGQLTMLLGRNGAGKTTTLRTIMGLWKASQGSVTFAGRDITAMATPDIARAGIAYTPENMGIFADLTVRENLLLAARDGDLDPQRLKWIFGLFPALEKFWSGGRFAFGRPEADAVHRPRHCRAAPALADRRADQGSGAGHHHEHDQRLPRIEGHRRHHPAGGAEFHGRQDARRFRRGDG